MTPAPWERLRRLWTTYDLTLRLLSLAVALAVWLVASTGPVAGRSQEVSVPLQVEGVPPGWEVVDAPDSVRVRYEAPSFFGIERLPGAITARVDVTGPAVGLQRLPVQVRAPGRVRLLAVNPTHVVVHLDRVVERELPLSAALVGPLPRGFWLGSVRLDPEVVRVAGLSQVVSRAAVAVAQISLDRVSPPAGGGTMDLPVPVAALDAGGTRLEGVRLEPSEVRVTMRFLPRQEP